MDTKTLYMAHDEADDAAQLVWDARFFRASRLAAPGDITLERLADLLDGHAEDVNAHDFVKTHRALAALLHQQVGRAIATGIFRRLVDFEGLHGLTGVGAATDPAIHEQELGVALSGSSWRLPEEK